MPSAMLRGSVPPEVAAEVRGSAPLRAGRVARLVTARAAMPAQVLALVRELVATSPADSAKPGASWRVAIESMSNAVLSGLPGYLGAFTGKPALVAQLPQVCSGAPGAACAPRAARDRA